MTARLPLVCASLVALSAVAGGQVTSDRLLRAADEPHNWLTYSRTYDGQRHSPLTQITPANVSDLELRWILPNQVFGAWQSTPLVVDGIMYLTQRPNDVLAVDARTGRVFWQYRYANSPDARVCCGANNRGLAMLGDTLYMGTLDAHLVAIDRITGRSRWDVPVGDPTLGYSITMAPLVVKDKVLVGSVVWTQAAYNDTVTNSFSLTGATRTTIPTLPVQGLYKHIGIFSSSATSLTGSRYDDYVPILKAN